MKSLSRKLIASVAVTAAWLAAGSIAEALPSLPHSRIDSVPREQTGRIEMIHVLPEWARAELVSPLSVNENGRGYFARSVTGLKETLDLGAGERGIRGHERPAKKAKARKTKRGFENQPLLPEPLERTIGKRPGTGTPASAEIPEPASSALLAIALVGWLGTVRPGRPR